MNQLYLKNLFYGSVMAFLLIHSEKISAQHPSPSKNGDRYDLVLNINKLQRDHSSIANLKVLIDNAKVSKNKKALKIHQEKLAIEKKNLKKDYLHAREQESDYKKNKSEKIKQLQVELKASDGNYELIRSKIKKDLAKKNDFALTKDADELLKAVQARNEISTQLSMEKSDMIATVNAMDAAWKKVWDKAEILPEKTGKVSSGTTLTNK